MWERGGERSGRESEDTGVYERETGMRDRNERKGERQGLEREKDKKRFRLGERMIGRETGVVQREREREREIEIGRETRVRER